MARGYAMAASVVADGAIAAPARSGITGWVMALLALAMFVNYTDRGSLSIAAPVLSRELALGPAAMGVLLSSFSGPIR